MSTAATPLTASSTDFFTGSAVGQTDNEIAAYTAFAFDFDTLIDVDSDGLPLSSPSTGTTQPITIYEPDYTLSPLPIGEYLPPGGGGSVLPQPPIRLATRGPISLRTRGRAPYTQTPANRTFNNINGTFFPVSGSQ